MLTVLAPFALGYFLSYLFRAVNAVVGPDLAADIGLSATALGLLTSAYLFAFALFQLPLGVLLDRYGPRRVQTGLFGCAAAGSLLFSIGDDVVTLTVARALIGLGFAGGLMSGFKAVVLWVPTPRRALANACIMSFGALGLLVATVPVELALLAIGWRAVFVGLALITLAVAGLILLAVPEQAEGRSESLAQQIMSVVPIYRDPVFWRLAPLLAITGGTHIAIQTLWAGPWFRDVAGLDRMAVANHLMVVAIAFLIGILSSGADRRLARPARRRSSDRDAGVPRGLLRLAARGRAADHLADAADLVPVRHVRPGRGAGLSVAVVALRRGTLGPHEHRGEPAAVPGRLRRAVRDRRDHRPVPAHSERRLQPARATAGLSACFSPCSCSPWSGTSRAAARCAPGPTPAPDRPAARRPTCDDPRLQRAPAGSFWLVHNH